MEFSKYLPLGRFFHRVAISRPGYIYISQSPFHVIFFEASHWPSDIMIRSRSFPRVFLGFSRGFPGVFPGFSQGFPNVFPGFSRYFPRVFPDKSHNLLKIVSVLLSVSVQRFFVSRMRNFFNICIAYAFTAPS